LVGAAGLGLIYEVGKDKKQEAEQARLHM
jgi:hypothetical protein